MSGLASVVVTVTSVAGSGRPTSLLVMTSSWAVCDTDSVCSMRNLMSSRLFVMVGVVTASWSGVQSAAGGRRGMEGVPWVGEVGLQMVVSSSWMTSMGSSSSSEMTMGEGLLKCPAGMATSKVWSSSEVGFWVTCSGL